MVSRRDRVYSQYPEPVIGYELNPDHGEFSFIIPEATENLCTNPSLENGVTTGYTAVGGSLTASTAWQAFGSYCSRMVPAVSTESGQYFGTISLTSGTTYTYSITMQGDAGKLYYVWFATTAGALIGAKKSFRATGKKQRVWVTYTETSSTTRRFYLTRDAQYADQNVFYADGLLVEAKDHPTTYTDGSLSGFVVGETPYLWTGTPHASTSTRSAQTRSGGREMNLLDFGIRVLSIIGLGLMPLIDQSLPIPGFGELSQGTGTKAREFVLVSEIDADNSRQMSAILSSIYDAVKPDLVVKDQPLILRYQQQDEDGDPCGESLDILCKYRTGLEGQNDNNHSRRVGITFKQYIPYIRATYDNGASLTYHLSVANANYIVQQSSAGVWSAMGAGTSSDVSAIVNAPDGGTYIGGAFTNLTDANGNYISKWNNTVFSSLGTGMNSFVYALAVGPDGTLYAGGNFTLAGGIANTAYIAKWNGTAWSALGTGMDGNVYALAVGPDGTLYAGGSFTLAGGVANTAFIAKWNGAAWSALGTGMNSDVYSLAVGPDGTLYAGGNFTLAGGIANTAHIAKWNGTAWSALGSGTSGGTNIVYSLLIGADGTLYAGGSFTLAGGVANTAFIAKWNGATWAPLGTGMNDYVAAMTFGPENQLYAGGNFTTAGGIALSDRIARWNGSTWLPLDADLPGASNIQSLMFNRVSNLFIGYGSAGSIDGSATTVITNSGSSKTSMAVTFVGPGTVYQIKSFYTLKAIYFDLTLLAGETAVLNLDPNNLSFVSSFRGNIYNTAILPGSNMQLDLLPGDNNISVYILGYTGATTVTARWVNQYNSHDAAVWK